MDVGVFVELEPVGVAKFTYVGSVVKNPLQALVYRRDGLKGVMENPL